MSQQYTPRYVPRELKTSKWFRAWDKSEGEWAKDYIVADILYELIRNPDVDVRDSYDLMAYTCLYDKHGAELCEGDVCDITVTGTDTHLDIKTAVIVYDTSVGAYLFKLRDGSLCGLNSKRLYSVVITSNVYESKEFIWQHLRALP